MKFTLLFLLIMPIGSSVALFDFTSDSEINNWRVVDDVVMGGRSSGNFSLTEDGHAKFSGNVSLENNGGFSSVRYGFPNQVDVEKYSKVRLKVKGDGKNYQFRIKANSRDYYSYITSFETNGEWEEIVIKLKDLYPSWRGRELDQPNYAGGSLKEVTFLIANYKNESFELLIDKIELF